MGAIKSHTESRQLSQRRLRIGDSQPISPHSSHVAWIYPSYLLEAGDGLNRDIMSIIPLQPAMAITISYSNGTLGGTGHVSTNEIVTGSPIRPIGYLCYDKICSLACRLALNQGYPRYSALNIIPRIHDMKIQISLKVPLTMLFDRCHNKTRFLILLFIQI